jgi:type II secretory pathway pseudopilin PulG
VAVLTAVIITNLYSSRGKARDAKRISDIAQIQLALEQYFNKNSSYPASDSGLTPAVLVTDGYISVLPTDPTSKAKYIYVTNASFPYYDYVLKATLEYINSATADALNSTPLAVTGCNSAGLGYCVGPK